MPPPIKMADRHRDDAVHRGLAGIHFDKSEITEISGDRCELRHRGYGIDQLIENPSYEKIAYLLLEGTWPGSRQYDAFRRDLAARRDLPDASMAMLVSLRLAPPHVALRTALSALVDDGSEQASHDAALDLTAKIPSIVVAHHALRQGRSVPPPDASLDHASDFLRRLLGRELSAQERHLINLDFVLHADHGANASTFVARVVASTGADVHAAFTAALAAFAGERHGGAVAGVAKMLDEIGSPAAVADFVRERRARNQPIMGFGHRVYRGEDPRALPFRLAARELCQALGQAEPLATLEALVEAMAPANRFGIGPNVDLYAAVIYRLLGIPDDLATSIFAAGRAAGWGAQFLEQIHNNILIRPRLLYVGPEARHLPPESDA